MKHVIQYSVLGLLLFLGPLLFSQTIGTTPSAKSELPTSVKKGTAIVSFFTSPGGYFATPGNQVYLDLTINPKVNYFILNRFNIGLGYLGFRSSSNESPQFNTYASRVEAELNYFFIARSKYQVCMQAGYVDGERPFIMQNFYAASMMKFGGSITWKLKCCEHLAFTLNTVAFFDHKKFSKFRENFYSSCNIGINYFLPSSVK